MSNSGRNLTPNTKLRVKKIYRKGCFLSGVPTIAKPAHQKALEKSLGIKDHGCHATIVPQGNVVAETNLQERM
jgi:hypothetical protein